MYRIISWYHRNKKTILPILVVFIVVIVIVQLMNYIEKNTINKNVSKNNVIEESTLNNISLSTQNSVISGGKITTSQKAIETLDQFIANCKEQNIEGAYNLLSEECKEEMYPSIENFKNSYYDKIFNGSEKNVSTENWIKDIYKVNYNKDFLTTGQYTKEDTIQDYITIVQNSNKEYKLNINKYIGREKIEKSAEYKDIQVEVVEKDTYMDYEVYTYKITNNSENTIVLGDTQDLYSIYLEDSNAMKYTAYVQELSGAQLEISPNEVKNIKIKYYNKYSSEKQIKYAVFSKVILNKNSFSGLQKDNYGRIVISL